MTRDFLKRGKKIKTRGYRYEKVSKNNKIVICFIQNSEYLFRSLGGQNQKTVLSKKVLYHFLVCEIADVLTALNKTKMILNDLKRLLKASKFCEISSVDLTATT